MLYDFTVSGNSGSILVPLLFDKKSLPESLRDVLKLRSELIVFLEPPHVFHPSFTSHSSSWRITTEGFCKIIFAIFCITYYPFIDRFFVFASVAMEKIPTSLGPCNNHWKWFNQRSLKNWRVKMTFDFNNVNSCSYFFAWNHAMYISAYFCKNIFHPSWINKYIGINKISWNEKVP